MDDGDLREQWRHESHSACLRKVDTSPGAEKVSDVSEDGRHQEW